MANTKISELSALTAVALIDELAIVDKSDVSGGVNGTTKKITKENLVTDIAVADGGTDADNAPDARTNLNAQALAYVTVGTNDDDDYVCDGVADQSEIMTAINAVNAAGGGVVYLRRGNYTISAGITLLSNVSLIGDGMNATIIKKVNNAAGIAGIQLSGVDNAQIRDLRVDGNKTNSATGRGINIINASTNILVERVKCIDAVEGFKSADSSDVVYRDCVADGNYEWNFYQYGGTRIKVLNCKSLNAKAGAFEGFGMAFYYNNVDCEAIGNYIYNSAHNGLQLNAGSATADVTGVIFKDNVVVSAGNRGIFITDDANVSYHVKNLVLSNNRVTSSHDQGIYLIDVYDSVVADNISRLNTFDGVLLESCVNVMVANNIAKNNSRNGVYADTCTLVTLANNVAVSNTAVGIGINTPTDECMSLGNMARNNGTGLFLRGNNNSTSIGDTSKLNSTNFNVLGFVRQIKVDITGYHFVNSTPTARPMFVDNIQEETTAGLQLGKSGGKVGFYDTAPIAKALLATGAAHTVDDVITALQNLGLVKQS